jgi:type I restriction enzyme S subunit
MVNMGELFAHDRIIHVSMERVPLGEKESSFLLHADDLLFARQSLVREGAGRCVIFKDDTEPVTFESHIIRVRLDSTRAHPDFFYYWFRSPQGRGAVDAIIHQVAAAGIRGSDLAKLKVPCPPLSHQVAIAQVLADLDDKIALNWRMNETLEDMARAMFRSWFVDFTRTDGKMPADWSRRPLGEWVDARSGGTPSKANPAFWGGDLPWISPKVMTDIHADEADAFVTPAAIGNGTRLAPKGSTLVMVRGMGLHQCVRVSQARREVTFNQDVKALVPRDIEPSLLLFAMLDAQAELLGRVESSGHGTGVLPTEILLSHPIAMPPRAVQTEMAKPFDLLNDRIALAREESRTLAELRDLLLPKLLSGELRIRDAERAVEAVA